MSHPNESRNATTSVPSNSGTRRRRTPLFSAVIFDLDNTLVDFMAMKRQAIDAAIDAMIDAGLAMDPTRVLARINLIYEEEGIEYQKVFDRLLIDILGEVDHKVLAAGVVSYRRAREAALKPYPHVSATLMELVKNGVRLAVLSDAPIREAWLRLSYIGFSHLFDHVVTFDDTGRYKPDPKPFRHVLDLLEIEPHEAIMVGDRLERDIAGASALGMKTAFARYGDVSGGDVEADYVLDDVKQLLDIVLSETG